MVGHQPEREAWERLNALWAKLPRQGESSGYHPLLAHMTDVAQVAYQIWTRVLPPSARSQVSAALGLGDDEVVAGRWVALFAGLHDLGKASPAFARQNPRAWDRICRSGFPCPPDPFSERLPHGWITAHALPPLLSSSPFELQTDVASQVGITVGGHHGLFPTSGQLEVVADDAREVGRGGWRDARRDLIVALAEALGYPFPIPAPARLDRVTAMYMAGLTSVADWVGSNTDFFPYVVQGDDLPAEMSSPGYWSGYAARAAVAGTDALRCLGWLGAPAPSSVVSFDHLFPFSANSLQQVAIEVAGRLNDPTLVVIEAPMGGGKTEAALFLADHLAARTGQRGFYVALPTQATSNQMLSRLRPFLASRYPNDTVNLQLLHGHAALSAEFELLRRNGDRLYAPAVVHDDEPSGHGEGHVLAAEWFTYRKRGLLAPFGVGTVDQALLAVLQAKHTFVRLFGLGHKVVIVDEVHAYDTYMSVLLGRLLEWLAALGASVILLSATLPRRRREHLLQAYKQGRGAVERASTIGPAQAYPRVTWVTKSGTDALAVPLAAGSVKVAIRHVEDPFADDEAFEAHAEELGRQIVEALRDGGCAAVIVSTVSRAQRLYSAFKRVVEAPAEVEPPVIDLFHARYLFKDRDEREQRALHWFGKPGARVVFDDGSDLPVARPRRSILIATQVVEQSLDLDFDLMVTDLAPADLVLQRLGRLHRHTGRTRPEPVREPTLWLLVAPMVDGVPRFGRDQIAVYDAHTLLRSWITLHERSEISLPDDVEPIVEATYDDDPPDELTPALLRAWEKTRAELDASIAAAEHEAEKRWLAAPTSQRPLSQFLQDPREEDAPDYHQSHQALTRLAELTVSVVLLYGAIDRATIDPDGGEPVDLRQTPDVALARRLLRRAVGLSDRRIVHTLAAMEPPSSWRRSALLRHHRLVVLDREGRASIDGRHSLRLDPDLGVVVDG